MYMDTTYTAMASRVKRQLPGESSIQVLSRMFGFRNGFLPNKLTTQTLHFLVKAVRCLVNAVRLLTNAVSKRCKFNNKRCTTTNAIESRLDTTYKSMAGRVKRHLPGESSTQVLS